MVQLSNRQRRAAAKSPKALTPTSEYMIIDPTHKPDLRGELAGGKVYVRGGKQHVRLTDRQAMFHRAQGKIAPVA
jgi:hypothetical protein